MRYIAELEDQFYTAWSKSASNLTRDGDTITNDAEGESDIALRIDVGTEGGPINLEIELEIESYKENLLCSLKES